MNIIKVNGKEYKTAGITFNTVCELEDNGITLADMAKKQTSFIRAYFAICANISVEEAGKELEQHIIGGGNFNEIIETIAKEVEESGFFRALTKKPTENATTVQTKAPEKHYQK